ncbi:MAG TPA: RcnB family protein [Sphingomonas sp.]|nr:RcnB family protein [Sphingomonas sp.]
MTGKFFKLLMAASALVPATMMANTASAQQVGQDRGDRGDRGSDAGQRQDRGQRPDRADRGPRQNGQGFQQQRPAAPDQAQRPQRADLGQQPQARGDRPDWNRQNRPRPQQGQQADQNRGEWNRGQGRPGFDRNTQQADRGQFDGNDGRRDRQDYGRNDGRGRYDRDGYKNRQPNRAYGTAQGYGRGGYNQGRYNQGGYNQGGAWNRGWRTDNRYAWSNYRASNRGAYRLPRYYAPSGWGSGYRRFGVGFSLNSILYNQNYWIQDPYTYRLPDAYGPYRWVRYYNDALLVDLDSGRVVDTVYDIFW